MSIFTALTNSVTGLRAQSYALENISDNIANSQTTGYKRVDTSFQDMVTDQPLRQQTGGSVMAFSRGTNTLSGAITTSGVGTNFALNGPGFVAVRERRDTGGALPTFSETNQYTRRGDFALDRDGYLVNGAGKYLLGYAVDPITDAVSTGSPEVMKVAVGLVPAQPSTLLQYTGNLPDIPRTTASLQATGASSVWLAAGGAAPAAVGPATVPSSASFIDNSISGQTPRLYDVRGNPVDVEVRWSKVASNAATGASTWGMYVNTNPGASSATSTWMLATPVTFNSAGQLTAPAGAVAVNLGAVGLGTINIDLSAGRLTQYADVSGQVNLRAITQDGYAAGELERISVSDNGRVMASFSNGQSRSLGQVAIAQFNAADMLKRETGGAFTQTPESGDALFGANGTTLVSGSLEGSNTDIAEEFSRMIVTQQAYSANTRVISTAQQMMQDIMNIVR